MLRSANESTRSLNLTVGDYVVLHRESTGAAQKLQNTHAGVYIVHNVESQHMVTLKDEATRKILSTLIHVDRLKIAYVSQPTPSSFFRVVTSKKSPGVTSTATQTDAIPQGLDSHESKTSSDTMTSDTTTSARLPAIQRPTRFRQKQIRFHDYDHVDRMAGTHSSISSDSDGLHKINQVLAQRHLSKGREFLVQIKGKPAQNAYIICNFVLNSKDLINHNQLILSKVNQMSEACSSSFI